MLNLNKLGRMVKCSKWRIIRYNRYDSETDPEHYYHAMLLLFMPFESEEELKPEANGYDTYHAFFEGVAEDIQDFVGQFEAFSDMIAEAYDKLDEDRQQRIADALAAADADPDAVDADMNDEDLDEDLHHGFLNTEDREHRRS